MEVLTQMILDMKIKSTEMST